MRIVFVNPPLHHSTCRGLGPIAQNLFFNSAPLGLCYLAAVARGKHCEVAVIDAACEGLSRVRLMRRIASFSPDIIGITTFTVSAQSAYALAGEIDTIFPAAKILIGGPHITSHPGDLKAHPEVDVAMLGEGETTFRELLDAFENGTDIKNVKGLALHDGGEVFFTPPREFITDLDSLPFPARDLIPMSLYTPQPNDQKRLPKLSMIASRGCPYSCIFCDKNVFKNTYRSFSPGYIVKEMSHLVRDFKAKDIAFLDSTFTPNKNRVYEIIREIKKANLDVTWTCSARADVLDEQLLKEMKDAGCWRVRLGVESGNETVLKFIKKGVTKQQVRKVAHLAYELDLEPKAFFMIGHLTDTRETIEETIDFACSLPLKDVTVQINTPLENTPQYPLVERYGKMLSRDFSDYTFFGPVFLPGTLAGADLRFYYAKFYLKFYVRPIIWYRHIRKISSFADIVKYVRGMRIIGFFFISWVKGIFSSGRRSRDADKL